jgi:dTMP kinase
MSGLFITFEGPEGSGKSTQVRLLAQSLKGMDMKVLTSREPGGTPFADSLRQILLDRATGTISAMAELLLLETARADHVEKVIRPALKNNCIVICDRFTDSSLAYQGGGRQIATDKVRILNDLATQGLEPDLTFVLDISPDTGLHRAGNYGNKEHDRLESEAIDFHKRVRETFLGLISGTPSRYVLLDGNDPVEIIAEKVLATVRKLLYERNCK